MGNTLEKKKNNQQQFSGWKVAFRLSDIRLGYEEIMFDADEMADCINRAGRYDRFGCASEISAQSQRDLSAEFNKIE